jgi:hypothetical protein
LVARADEIPKSRWQVLPLTELFYASHDETVVSAAFDLPCGAQPIGVLLIDQGTKLQLAAMVSRPLAACARLPERRMFRLPFIDSSAYKIIEPLRGDLDGIRVDELNTFAVNQVNGKPQFKVDIPCGVRPAGLVVLPGQGVVPTKGVRPMRLAAVGFRESPRRVAADCGSAPEAFPAPRQGLIRVAGLVVTQRDGSRYAWQVMPRKVSDLRKLGVLELRGIDRVEKLTGKSGRLGIVHFKHRCYEVPVGVALVPRGNGQAMAVAVARYINAPCLTRQARVPELGLKQATLSLLDPRATALTTEEIERFNLGQLILAPGSKGDVAGVVLTSPGAVSSESGDGRLQYPRGYFAFVARSRIPGGAAALRQSGIQMIDTSNPLAVASRLAGAAGFPRTAVAGNPLRLQITSAL